MRGRKGNRGVGGCEVVLTGGEYGGFPIKTSLSREPLPDGLSEWQRQKKQQRC